MRALVMHGFGGEEVLELADVPPPEPAPGEVLVRVGAVEVSGTRDVATRTGKHAFSQQVTLPHVLGGDFAGTVEAVGPGVDAGWAGRRVAASCSVGCGTCAACLSGHEERCAHLAMVGVHRWGSYAEFAAVPAANLTAIPDDLPMAQAAALAATGPIAFTQLAVGQVHAGAWLLVTGATGSLGSVLLELAAHLGARGIAISRRPAELAPGLACEHRLDAADPALGDVLRELTGGEGVEIAVDNVADPGLFARYFPALALGSRIVISGAITTPAPPVLAVPALPLYLRSISLTGVRTTNHEDTAAFWRLVRDGFRPPDGTVVEHPLEDAPAVHARVAGGARHGHDVLVVQA